MSARDPEPNSESAPKSPTPPDAALLARVYDQLHSIARARMAEERPGHTLQATALVHEAWLRLAGGDSTPGNADGKDEPVDFDEPRFFEAAALAMRRILIEHARGKHRLKRGGDRRRVLLDVVDLADADDSEEIVAVEEAVRRLESQDAEAARVVNLRFFAGLDVEATARTLGVSPRTVAREWEYARAWLFRALSDRRS